MVEKSRAIKGSPSSSSGSYSIKKSSGPPEPDFLGGAFSPYKLHISVFFTHFFCILEIYVSNDSLGGYLSVEMVWGGGFGRKYVSPYLLYFSVFFSEFLRILEICVSKDRLVGQRWKNVQILQIYLCYFSLAVLIFWLYTQTSTVLSTLC